MLFRMCCVDIGEDELLQIVCGADNIYEGALVPVALHKSALNRAVIKKTNAKNIILMAGLQGSGKTTTTVKLARRLKDSHNPLVVEILFGVLV